MHVPSGFCSASVCVAAIGLSTGAVIASRWLDRLDARPRLAAPALAALGAAVFAAQMLNVPVASGTSGHIVGGALLGILAGPCNGLLAMVAILATQALLFGDGGISALGVNILTMGAVGVLGGWSIHRWLSARTGGPIAAGIAAAAATIAAAAVCALALGLSGAASTASALAAMSAAHLPIALIEGAVTAVVVAAVASRPSISVRWPTAAAVAACLLAPFASALPDGLESTAAQLGFADRAVGFAAPLAGAHDGIALVLAGLVGAAVVWVLVRYSAGRSA